MGGRGSASSKIKKRKGGKNKGQTRGAPGTPYGDEPPSLFTPEGGSETAK